MNPLGALTARFHALSTRERALVAACLLCVAGFAGVKWGVLPARAEYLRNRAAIPQRLATIARYDAIRQGQERIDEELFLQLQQLEKWEDGLLVGKPPRRRASSSRGSSGPDPGAGHPGDVDPRADARAEGGVHRGGGPAGDPDLDRGARAPSRRHREAAEDPARPEAHRQRRDVLRPDDAAAEGSRLRLDGRRGLSTAPPTRRRGGRGMRKPYLLALALALLALFLGGGRNRRSTPRRRRGTASRARRDWLAARRPGPRSSSSPGHGVGGRGREEPPLFRSDRRPYTEAAGARRGTSMRNWPGSPDRDHGDRGRHEGNRGEQGVLQHGALEVKVGDDLPGFKVKAIRTEGLAVTAEGREFLLPLYAGPPTAAGGGPVRTEVTRKEPAPAQPKPATARPRPGSAKAGSPAGRRAPHGSGTAGSRSPQYPRYTPRDGDVHEAVHRRRGMRQIAWGVFVATWTAGIALASGNSPSRFPEANGGGPRP